MKSKFFLVALYLLSFLKFSAQFSYPPQHMEFNTGQGPGPGNCLYGVGVQDDVWMVSVNGGPSNSAIKVPYVSGLWAIEGPACGYTSGWIGANLGCPTGGPANHGCSGGTVDLDFMVNFILPPNPVLVLDWLIAADDRIVDITVNGITAYASPPGSTHRNNPLTFKWCKNWQQGLNKIVIHVRSVGLTGPPTLNYAGLKVESWMTPVVNPMTTSGSPTVCSNSSNTTYTVTQVPPGTISYQWEFTPAGWTGSSNQTTINPSFGTSSVVLNTYAMSAQGCVGATTLNITTVTPTIGIVPSHPAICPGYRSILTATGGVTYSWSPPVAAINAMQNPITATPTVATFYNVTGWDANGCKNTASYLINMLPLPVPGITSSPPVICSGTICTLTASGASTYTWYPLPGLVANTMTVTPPMSNTSYSLIAMATNGCTNTAVITLTPGATIPISAITTTYCSDINACTTLTAVTNFPGVNYSWEIFQNFWFPIPGNQSTVSVCPSVNSIYRVNATSNLGCQSSASLAVQVQTCCPPGTATFALPSSTYCNVSFTNLAQYASVTGTFSGTGVTFSNGQYHFNAAGNLPGNNIAQYPVTLTYTTAPHGCSYTLVQYVKIITPPNIYASMFVERCAYSPVPSILGAQVYNATPNLSYSYSWTPGGMVSQTISVSPTVTTMYTVTAYAGGCVVATTASITVNHTCCPQTSVTPILSPTLLTVGGSLNGPIIIDKDLTISGNGNYTFQTGDFVIHPGVKITLLPGVNLILKDAHLFACYQPWQGIVVRNGANVTSAPGPLGLSTLIEDANIAISIDSIETGHSNPLLNLDGVIFNKNNIGISLTNSSLTSIPVLLKSCVFTIRNFPTGTLQWPSSSSNPGGLRYASPTSIATSLSAPFILSPNYPFVSSLNQFASIIGIQISNIGNIAGGNPNVGVNLTSGISPSGNDFNLFDGMTTAIRVDNASLTTFNNTFQNINYGIVHTITSLMNARLSLIPSQQNTANRFWLNKWIASGSVIAYGIAATNVLEFDLKDAVFRGFSTHSSGINISTNRFSYYTIRNSTFSNLTFGIGMNFYSGAYLINGMSNLGVYGNSLDISSNFFGPQINSAAAVNPNERLDWAIGLSGDSAAVWQLPGVSGPGWTVTQPNFVQNNIIDRASNGIQLKGMSNYPLGIINNTIGLIHNPTSGGYGMQMQSTFGLKSIRNNVIQSDGYDNIDILCINNYSPAVTCNTVSGGFCGLQISGNNIGTWTGNVMNDNIYGLWLTDGNGQGTYIGHQGNALTPSGNQWIGSWGGWATGRFETVVDFPTDAFGNQLYIEQSYPFQPINNLGVFQYGLNTTFPSLHIVSTTTPGYIPYTCPSSQLLQRTSIITNLSERTIEDQGWMKIYPNPSVGRVTVVTRNESEVLKIKIIDMMGKIIYSKTITTANYEGELDLPFTEGIYLISIQNESKQVFHEKLIITNK